VEGKKKEKSKFRRIRQFLWREKGKRNTIGRGGLARKEIPIMEGSFESLVEDGWWGG